jgi:hypothetical protein
VNDATHNKRNHNVAKTTKATVHNGRLTENIEVSVTSKAAPKDQDATIQSGELAKYQLYAISPEQVSYCKEQIKQDVGVRPGLVRTDEQNNIIFGHDWFLAAAEMNVDCAPELVKYGANELLKWQDAAEHSLRGVNLGTSARENALKRYLTASDDARSATSLAHKFGVSPTTAIEIIKELEGEKVITRRDKRLGGDGKWHPTQRVVCSSNKQHANVIENIEDLPISPRPNDTLDYQRAKARIDREKHRKKVKDYKDNLPPYDPELSAKYGLHCLDFRRACEVIKPGSVDIAAIDPPNGRKWIDNWEEFATVLYELLKPHGTVIGWAGRDNTRAIWPQIRMKYEGIVHRGINTVGKSMMRCRGEPIILATKGRPKWPGQFDDEFQSVGKEEQVVHKWQKPLADVVKMLEGKYEIGNLVMDLTAGSFTTALACMELQLGFVGLDNEPDCIRIGLDRIKRHKQEMAARAEIAKIKHLPLVRPAPLVNGHAPVRRDVLSNAMSQ